MATHHCLIVTLAYSLIGALFLSVGNNIEFA